MKQPFLLSVVVPVYNEETVLAKFFTVLRRSVSKYHYEIIFVDDGSVDLSLKILQKFIFDNKQVRIVKLKRNFGQQEAIYAGLNRVRGDCVVVLDADLQDPPRYIQDMVNKWQAGYKIVFAKRKSRNDRLMKRVMAFVFYRLYKIINRDAYLNVGDFYLLDKKVVKNILSQPKSKLFLRGAIAKQKLAKTSINVKRNARTLGKSKYSLIKMLKLGLNAFRQNNVNNIDHNDANIIEQIISAHEISKRNYLNDKKSIAILGGGFCGLLIGYYLSKKGYRITIYEQTGRVGGLLATDKYRNTLYEVYYHHIFLNDKLLLELIDEFGLSSKIVWKQSRSACFNNDQFLPINSPIEWWRFPNIILLDKVRGWKATRRIAKIKARDFHHMRAYDFIKSYFGASFLNCFWKPLFEKKFYSEEKNVSAAWFIARLQKRAGSRRNGKEVLGYMKGSFQLLTDKLHESIVQNGGKIILKTTVDSVEKHNSNYLVNGEHFNYLISTIANPEKVLKNVLSKKDLLAQSQIKYLAIVCANIISKKKLSPYYWLNIFDRNIPFVSFVEQTNLINYRLKNFHLSYLGWYLPESALSNLNRVKIIRYVKDAINKMFPASKAKLNIKIRIDKYAQPIISDKIKIPAVKTSDKNIFITNMGHIYPDDRGLNEAVAEAQKIAAMLP